jgi:hypothetical protein
MFFSKRVCSEDDQVFRTKSEAEKSAREIFRNWVGRVANFRNRFRNWFRNWAADFRN